MRTILILAAVLTSVFSFQDHSYAAPNSSASDKLERLEIPLDEFPKLFLERSRGFGLDLQFYQSRGDCRTDLPEYHCQWRTKSGISVNGNRFGDTVKSIEIWTGIEYDVNTTPQVYLAACATAIALAAPEWPKDRVLKVAKQLASPPKSGRIELPFGSMVFIGRREPSGPYGVPPIWHCHITFP